MKKFITKNVQTICLALLTMLSVVSSCRRGNTNDGSSSQKIEYAGRIIFNQDKTGIESISRNGYIKFAKNNRKVAAEAGPDGRISYQFDGGDKVNTLSLQQKQFLAEAVKTIIKERSKLLARKY